MKPEVKRVREEIAKQYSGGSQRIGKILADRILSIKGVVILADDQTYYTMDDMTRDDMIKKGFRRVILSSTPKSPSEKETKK